LNLTILKLLFCLAPMVGYNVCVFGFGVAGDALILTRGLELLYMINTGHGCYVRGFVPIACLGRLSKHLLDKSWTYIMFFYYVVSVTIYNFGYFFCVVFWV
jgi:hypothetical protein